MAEKPWRPPRWVLGRPIAQSLEDIPKDGIGEARLLTPHEIQLFEAGADAMLGALFELARASPTKEFIIDGSEHHIYAKGE